VHERHLRSGRVDGRAMGRDVGQRLAAERSAEVAQKDQKHRRPALQFIERSRQLPTPRIGSRSHSVGNLRNRP
jgi:hypothetical protein